jgi:hypothetical protein
MEFAGEVLGQFQRLPDAVRRDDRTLVADRHHFDPNQFAFFLKALA